MNTVDVASIERELTALWKQAGEDEDGAITRACLLNLLVYIPSEDESNKVKQIIAEVTSAHPSRAILMIADRDADESSISAEVTSICALPTGMTKQVCCEQVTITARKAQVEDVASVVVPLLLSDLPVYLWWDAVPSLDDKAFKRLVDVSDRVIIDSADFADPQGDLLSLAGVLRDNHSWASFSDLNWSRLTTWRALIAGFYDVAEYRSYLDRLDRVTIEYAPQARDSAIIPARAALLAGWLVSRLKWQLDAESIRRGDGSIEFDLSSASGKVTIEFVPTRVSGIRHGMLAAATLNGTADGATASFKVRRSSDAERIYTEVTVGEQRHIERVLSYENWEEGRLIARELEILGRDRVYEQAVLSAGELINAFA